MRILGIHLGHNAGAAVLEDGKIVFAQSEERFNRIKNSTGFPLKTVQYVNEKFGNFDLVVINGSNAVEMFNILKKYNFQSYKKEFYFKKFKKLDIKYLIKFILFKFFKKFFLIANYRIKVAIIEWLRKNAGSEEKMKDFIADKVNVDKKNIIFVDHHLTHALSPAFNLKKDKKTLIFTLDGEGDDKCATVNIYKGGNIEVIYEAPKENSLGYLWYYMTGFLGMKPIEDEYKVMGLAPYAKKKYAEEVINHFRDILWVDENGKFQCSLPTSASDLYFLDKFLYERFDNLALGIQLFTEELVTKWIRYWINKTGIGSIALSGGVFLNVKLNKKILEMDEVKELFVMPSAGDESSIFGACFYGYKKYCEDNHLDFNPSKFSDLYLGVEFDNKYVEKFINDSDISKKWKVYKPTNINFEVARLLAKDEIVARFSGRMEFGARALGNRSILANPSNYKNVRIINEMVKNRDFWMPFAVSILDKYEDKYLINPKKFHAPYMIMTFDTKDAAKTELKAGIHQYDFTTRPQIVTKDDNPGYYELISKFNELTGIGGVLNTSFNLHGYPIVCSPEDAIEVFENSGLKYLALGEYMICKE